jgi:hypothetical protein
MKNTKALVWGLSIVGVGLAIYIVATLTKKDTTNKSILNAGTIGAIGNAISGLFSSKTSTPAVSPYTGVAASAGTNYYNTGIGSLPSSPSDWSSVPEDNSSLVTEDASIVDYSQLG